MPNATSITRAFTTRIPLAAMILMGIKRWENRAAMPIPSAGVCGISCSKGSDECEYTNFFSWAQRAMRPEVYATLPPWERISDWRGKLIAICDYEASYTPGDRVWNEGYQLWWKLDNVRLLPNFVPVRGNVGMWSLEPGIVV